MTVRDTAVVGQPYGKEILTLAVATGPNSRVAGDTRTPGRRDARRPGITAPSPADTLPQSSLLAGP